MDRTPYFLGLDIGTDSVGWAVTDQQYNLLKCHGKTLWGARLFDKAQTAEKRRTHRTNRRRLERRNQRLQWLQEVFSEEIAKKDPAFFQRLRESKFLEEDKRGDRPLGRYTLFADKNYCDSDYHKQYPTIYRLRRELIESDTPHDVRLVYLAIHHIMKHRGHFLYGDLRLEESGFDAAFARLQQAAEEEFETALTVADQAAFKNLLLKQTLSKKEKNKQLKAQLGAKAKTRQDALADLLAGSKVSLRALYDETISTDEIDKVSLEDDLSEKEQLLLAALGDRIELILAAKGLYDWALLEKLRAGEQYISVAKDKSYSKHQEDLQRLKDELNAHGDRALYREIFHDANAKNYPAYTGHDTTQKRCGYDEFSNYLLSLLKPLRSDRPAIEQICTELEQGTFLPLQSDKNNSVIPHQLHEIELVKILENAGHYLPFLNEKDASGLTKAEQIHQMFCFRVPYYVGPLSPDSPNSWIVRTGEKIYPWNFAQVVDLEQCRKNFIMRMTAKCSYIGEDVLPKDSLLYSSFMVLNELNNLKINGHPISVEMKQQLYRELFLNEKQDRSVGKKITRAGIKKHLLAAGQLEKTDELSGIDDDFKAALTPWRYFEWLVKRENGVQITEDIIRQATLFGKDRELLQNWLKRTYGNSLTEAEQRKALSFKPSGWGRLSRVFLTELYHVDQQTGEAFSIMDLLWSTNDNLMELLSSRYMFGEAVQQYRRTKNGDNALTLQDYLDECYASPAIKRAIHQVIGIVSEVQSIMKMPPKRIFVEMARGDGEKGKRTVSRKDALLSLYKKCGEESGALFEALGAETEGSLRRDKMYLYYTQLGRCMYSKEPIDLNRLDSDYDIDHIYPQSKVKDDSINNRVLVKRTLNGSKGDRYPIDPQIQTAMRPFWKELREKGLIEREKYERLIRATSFTLEEQAGFINRQLVETRQSGKIAAELLQQRFGDACEVVYGKAGNVSSFRQDQRLNQQGQQVQAGQCMKNEHTQPDPLFVKCREVNDFHHAKDAYLNIVVGNVYHVKFTRSPANFLREDHAKFSLNRMFDFDVSRGGENAWKAGPDGSIAVVRRMMRKNNVLLTRRTLEEKGKLYEATIQKKKKTKNTCIANIKDSDIRMVPEKYGYYDSLAGTYFFLVEHTKKEKNKYIRVRSIETVLLVYKDAYERDPEEYCRVQYGLIDPIVLVSKIRINDLLVYNGFRMHISSRTGDQLCVKNANPLIIAPEWHQYCKQIMKYVDRCKVSGRELDVTKFDGVTQQKNERFYQILQEKLAMPPYNGSITCKHFAEHMQKDMEAFKQLSISAQCVILKNCLNIFADDVQPVNWKLLGRSEKSGILKVNKIIYKENQKQCNMIQLIRQSITGVFEQKIDLLGDFSK